MNTKGKTPGERSATTEGTAKYTNNAKYQSVPLNAFAWFAFFAVKKALSGRIWVKLESLPLLPEKARFD
jgi:hypothetical protein